MRPSGHHSSRILAHSGLRVSGSSHHLWWELTAAPVRPSGAVYRPRRYPWMCKGPANVFCV